VRIGGPLVPAQHIPGTSTAGDTLEPGIFNPSRYIVFDPEHDGGDDAAAAHVVEQIKLLESNATAQERWFSQPSVLPAGARWLNEWCHNATDFFRKALLRKGHRVWPNLK